MSSSGFWQRTLDGAVMLFILGVIALKVAVVVKVICIDWGQIFSVAGILAFVMVLLCAVRKVFSDDEDEMPTLVDHPKTAKGGGK